MDVLMWAIMVVVFVIFEIITIQLVSIWLAAGALITMVCAYFFDMSIEAELLVFLLTSTAFLLITMPFLRKRLKKGFTSTNADLDVGKKAKVIEEIDPDSGSGRVTLSGVDWSAVSEDGGVISEGTVVIVVAVKGAKLTVRPEV